MIMVVVVVMAIAIVAMVRFDSVPHTFPRTFFMKQETLWADENILNPPYVNDYR